MARDPGRRRPSCCATLILLCVTLAGCAQATGDVAAGKGASSKCVGCHGSQGQGSPGTPALAGRPRDQLLADMKAYRSGTKQHILMSRAGQHLTDQEIADLAAYYSALD